MVCCIIYLTYVVLLVMHAATTLITVYFVHMGIWQGAPVISSGLYIWKGIIPARRAISLGAGYSLPLIIGINTFWEKSRSFLMVLHIVAHQCAVSTWDGGRKMTSPLATLKDGRLVDQRLGYEGEYTSTEFISMMQFTTLSWRNHWNS
jgi:hypothetical protein